jgi:hypothetical protein
MLFYFKLSDKIVCIYHMQYEVFKNVYIYIFRMTKSSFFFFAVLGFELRAYTLNHSTSPFLWRVFSRQGLVSYLPGFDFEP